MTHLAVIVQNYHCSRAQVARSARAWFHRRMGQTVVGHAGRYDDIAEKALREADAKGVVLIVIEGKHGFGMSVPTRPEAAIGVNMHLPALLRAAADLIEQGHGPDGVRITTEGLNGEG